MRKFTGLEKLVNAIPVESLVATENHYAPMDTDLEGSWSAVHSGETLLGVAWTDWDISAGFLSAVANDESHMLRLYFVTAKDMGIPASNAFTVFPVYAESHMDSVKIQKTQTGLLQGVIDEITGKGDSDGTS